MTGSLKNSSVLVEIDLGVPVGFDVGTEKGAKEGREM